MTWKVNFTSASLLNTVLRRVTKTNNVRFVSEDVSLMYFIYILVWINLDLVNAPMHTENLKVPADALHYHSIQYATMCFASYKQRYTLTHEQTLCCTLDTALHYIRFSSVYVFVIKY